MFCILPSLSVLVFAPQIFSCFGMGTSCRAERLTEERLGITIQALSQVLTLGKATEQEERTRNWSIVLSFPAFPAADQSQVLQSSGVSTSHTLEW